MNVRKIQKIPLLTSARYEKQEVEYQQAEFFFVVRAEAREVLGAFINLYR